MRTHSRLHAHSLCVPHCVVLCCVLCPQLDAAGYKSLIDDIKQACTAGDLSPPTLCRLGFHSVHIACTVGKGWGANGGFHAFEVDYDHPSNGGMGDDIAFLLKVMRMGREQQHTTAVSGAG